MARQNHNGPSPARRQSARRWARQWVATIRLLAACAAGLAVSCTAQEEGGHGNEADGRRPLASTLARDIELEAGEGPPVVGLDYLAADSAGNLFVLDARAGRLHKYTAAGRHVGALAGADGEPVFLRQPAGPGPGGVVVGRDGNVYVAAAPHGMFDRELTENLVKGAVTRVSPALVVDTVFTIRGPEAIGLKSAWRRELAVVLGRPRDAVERAFGLTEEEVLAREEVLLLTYDGVPTTVFHPADERRHGVPYWGGWFSTYTAVAGDELLVVSSLYPIHRYRPGGELVGTFGSASPSFRQPSEPEPRTFPTEDARYYEWRSTFTTIGGIHVVADSLVVVVLVDRNADEPAVAQWSYRADVYDLRSGSAVARDVDLEGPVLHADTLLYVAWQPTGDGWHVGLFDLSERR